MDALDDARWFPEKPAAWWLANRYPEVCRAHAEFGGNLEDMLRQYHCAVITKPSADAHSLRTGITVRDGIESEQNAGEIGYKHE